MKPNSLVQRLAGSVPGILLWLAVLPVATLGQANYSTPYTFITLAGKAGAAGSADGTNSSARFDSPDGVAVDSAGNLYVADGNNNTIRRVTPAGVVTTLAGSAGMPGSTDGTNSDARFAFPAGVLAVDGVGNVYVTDCGNNTVRKLTPVGTDWVVTTLAGRAGVSGGVDGTNSAARFNGPFGVAADSTGNLYVGDGNNNTIRKLTPVGTNWVVTTLAGRAGNASSADGTNSAARFNGPLNPAVDSAGSLYVADYSNDTIRKVTPVGTNWVVTTLAGVAGSDGNADGTNSEARFFWPFTAAVDSAGNLYVADYSNDTIRKVTPVGTNWVVTTLAGLTENHGSADWTGSAARFSGPGEIALDSAGNLYVTDYNNNTIRKGFPANAVPAPMLQAPSLSASRFGFEIIGVPGLAVNIESSTNLSQWQVFGPILTLVGGSNTFVNPTPSQGAQFYRAHVR